MTVSLPPGSLEITVKTSLKSDAGILARLDKEQEDAWDEERFSDYFSHSKTRFAIFAMAGTVEVGYLMFDISEKKRIFLDRLFVLSKFRRRHVASQLVDYLLEKAPKLKSIEEVVALVGLETDDLPMLNFFKSIHVSKAFLVEHPESPGTINFVQTIREAPPKKGKKKS